MGMEEIRRAFAHGDEHDLAQALGVNVAEHRVRTLIRRAQNNIDRAHNRAIDLVTQNVSLTPDDANAVRLLKRKVRHAQEFGEK